MGYKCNSEAEQPPVRCSHVPSLITVLELPVECLLDTLAIRKYERQKQRGLLKKRKVRREDQRRRIWPMFTASFHALEPLKIRLAERSEKKCWRGVCMCVYEDIKKSKRGNQMESDKSMANKPNKTLLIFLDVFLTDYPKKRQYKI